MKKLLHYIYNFFYFAINWNLPLAFFITWHEIKRGRQYGINTFMRHSLEGLTISGGDISHSSPYEAVNFYILENLLENFRKIFPEEKSLTDVGCGKGRVLAAAAHFCFTHITGIDFAKELCDEAERNIKKIQPYFPETKFAVHWINILNYPLKAEDKVFFLFNPFNKETLARFVENIEQSLIQFPRRIYFIYASPKQFEVLLDKNYQVVYRIKKMKFLEGLIAVKESN